MHQTGIGGLDVVEVLIAAEVELRFVGLRLRNGRLRFRGFCDTSGISKGLTHIISSECVITYVMMLVRHVKTGVN